MKEIEGNMPEITRLGFSTDIGVGERAKDWFSYSRI